MDNRSYGIIKKYVRGSIWFYNEPSDVTQAKLAAKDRTMAYSHPYLILSSQGLLDNPKNPVVLAVPMTSNCTKSGKFDITTTDIDGKPSRILCSQVTSIDVQFIGGYVGTADDVLMKQVEDAMLASVDIISGRQYEQKIAEAENEVKELKDSVASLNAELEDLRKSLAEKDSEIEEAVKLLNINTNPLPEDFSPISFVEKEPAQTEEKLPKLKGVEMTQREYDILTLAENHTYQEIADLYDMTAKNVANTLYRLRKKLGISPRAKKDTQMTLDDMEVVKIEDVIDTAEPVKYDESEILEMEYFGKVGQPVKTMSKKRRERYA